MKRFIALIVSHIQSNPYHSPYQEMATTAVMMHSLHIPMIAETSFIENLPNGILNMLKHEAIDRLDSVVDDLPKYRKALEKLIDNFTVEDMLSLMNTIYRDTEFKKSAYYKRYNRYFDEIEDLIYKNK